MSVMLQRISMLAAALVVVAGCSTSATGSPSVTGPAPTQSPAIVAPSATPAATATPAPTPTAAPSAQPSPVVYEMFQKNAEGGHGGPALITLPASIVVDYTVRGTCTFTIDLDTATSIAGPNLKLSVTGPESSGSWHLSIKPGSYYVNPGEALGCTFSITVRDPA